LGPKIYDRAENGRLTTSIGGAALPVVGGWRVGVASAIRDDTLPYTATVNVTSFVMRTTGF
jgi:hypothetical protein